MFFGTVTHRKTKAPLEGVPVCDGRNITFTDKEGKYSLPGWEKTHVIFLSILTRDHSDWYFYVESGRERYDFVTTPEYSSSDDVTFLHSSDIEITDEENFTWMSFMRSAVQKTSAAFYINTGDLAREKLPVHYLCMNRETVGCPVRYAIGNHDFTGDRYGDENYERHYGPTWYSFDAGGVHFVTLSMLMGDKGTDYTHEEQLSWLKNDLETLGRGKPVFIFCHKWMEEYEWYEGEIAKNDILNLRSYNCIGFAVGHHHVNVLHDDNGMLKICSSRPDSGGIDSSFGSLRRISYQGGKLSSDMILYEAKKCHKADTPIWKTALGGSVEYGNPICFDGKILIATNDSGYPKNCGIYAVDEHSGSIVWSIKRDCGFKGGVSVSDGIAYACDTRGRLLFIDAKNGDVLKEIDMIHKATAFYTCTPVIAENKVIAGISGPVFAYDKISGELLWQSKDLPRSASSPARYVFDEKRRLLLVSINWFGICALNIDDGSIAWKSENGKHHVHFRSGTPALTDDRIIIGSLSYATAIDPENGQTLFYRSTGARMDSSGGATVFGDKVYFNTGTVGIIETNYDDLKPTAIFEASVAAIHSTPYVRGRIKTVEGAPFISDDELIFADNGAQIRIFDRKTKKLKKKINVGAPVTTSPIVKDGTVLVADIYGTVSKFKL